MEDVAKLRIFRITLLANLVSIAAMPMKYLHAAQAAYLIDVRTVLKKKIVEWDIIQKYV